MIESGLKRGRAPWLLVLALHLAFSLGVEPAPAQAKNFKTKNLLDKYTGENARCTRGQRETLCCTPDEQHPLLVKYYSLAERQQFKLEFRDGKVMQAGRTLPHVSQNDSRTERDYIYSMDTEGNIYVKEASPALVCKFHHSSFVAGAPVAGAGQMKIKDGRVTFIDNFSGHYHPPDELLDQVLAVLRENKVEVEQIRYFSRGPVDAAQH